MPQRQPLRSVPAPHRLPRPAVVALVALAALPAAACARRGPGDGAGVPNAPGAAAAGATAAASGTTPDARRSTTFPATWPLARVTGAAVGERAMVSSNSREASEAGVEILRRGGNAVDAAVAVGFALAVTHPEAGNIGGGGYMLIRTHDGRVAALDYREMAPAAATREMFVTNRTPGNSDWGHLASGVPGAVAGMTEAHRRFGALPLADVLAPAIRLAEEGVVVDTALARSLESYRDRAARFAGAATFYPGGRLLTVGERFRQPVLGRTLRLIARGGAAAFYRGEIGDSLVAEMRRGGGIITKDDLARYRPVWREALQSRYRGHTVLAMPPSSSGGIALTELLNVLEARGALPPFGSAARTHLLAEALRRVFIDRNTKVGDPAFVQVPVARLTSDAYARRLAETIDPRRATPTAALEAALREGSETTHYSVVDADGNAVATTTTINELYGSGVFVPGAGFFLNNEMDDFATRPGRANIFGAMSGEQNVVQPGKRPLSAMSPTIVLDPAGRLLLVIGSRGGPRIISSVAQVITNVIDDRMSLAEAMAAPRIHHQAVPDTLRYEGGGLAPAVVDSLRAMGHAVSPSGYAPAGFIGRVHAVMRVGRGYEGVVDPRTSGGAVGY